ncbi:hypothetical protein JCM5353_002536, partial [Sporobolomyces roseus]
QIETKAQFDRGEVTILVSTKAIQHGVDTKRVAIVVFLDLESTFDRDGVRPFVDTLDLIQQAGRAGRDDSRSQIYLLQKASSPFLSPEDYSNTTRNHQVLDDLLRKESCLQETISNYLDGANNTISCHPGSLCSYCHEMDHHDNPVRQTLYLHLHLRLGLHQPPLDPPNVVPDPTAYASAQHDRRLAFAQKLSELLGPLDPTTRKDHPETDYLLRSHPCAWCWGFVVVQYLLATLGQDYIPLPDPLFPSSRTAPPFHSIEHCNSLLPAACNRCGSFHHLAPRCPCPKLSNMLRSTGTKTSCYKCALRHAYFGYEFISSDNFQKPGVCDSGVGQFFWVFPHVIWSLLENNTDVSTTQILQLIDPAIPDDDPPKLSLFES